MWGNKIMVIGIGLSPLGLGYFLPVLIPAAAIVVFVGAVLVLIDR